jgi:hypothetical protein
VFGKYNKLLIFHVKFLHSTCHVNIFLIDFAAEIHVKIHEIVFCRLELRNNKYQYRFLSSSLHFIHSFIHSFCSLPYYMSIVSSKASSPQAAIQCFLFQFSVSSVLRSSSMSSSSSSRHFYPSLYVSFNIMF